MGSVYLARRVDREFERLVAIKMIRRGMDSDLLVKRFRHERQILASLDHPHIARLFDGGTTDDGLPYFVMEYVDGVPIDRYADDHRLPTPERLRLCLRVIDAVQHAHERQIVHRDLKPSNVLVTADGQPKLLDFGIAKLLDPEADGTSTLTSLARPMTPDYASPEQVRGEPVTQASDVYALGLLLYELLTGHRPYRLTTHTPEEMARVVCEQDPERPSAVVARVRHGHARGRHGRRHHAGDRERHARRIARAPAPAFARRARRHRAEGTPQGPGVPLCVGLGTGRRHSPVSRRRAGGREPWRVALPRRPVRRQAPHGDCGVPRGARDDRTDRGRDDPIRRAHAAVSDRPGGHDSAAGAPVGRRAALPKPVGATRRCVAVARRLPRC